MLRPALRPVLLVLALSSNVAADEFEARFHPRLVIHRSPGPIEIDGELDDSGWRGAARADGFAEVRPGDAIEPVVETEAWITYDEKHLYVALIAHDDPQEVRVSVCDRDRIFQDDYIGVMFDPYADQSSGYEFFVNPLGIQGDLRLRSDGNEDMSFDAIWHSKGRLTETGYQVEIAIPFTSLRMPGEESQTWRMNFWRDRQRNVRRQMAWAALNRDDPCFMCQWGTVDGIEGVEAGKNFEVIAAAVGGQSGAMEDTDDPDSPFDTQDPDADGSLFLKYGVTSFAFAEVAVNPDFSQIESDAGRIDVNQTFALFFPERRPFFQEGSDLLDTWISAIYTRSINDPRVTAKGTAQSSRLSGVYTFAEDQNSPLIIPLEERSYFAQLEGSRTNYGRFRKPLQNESFVGALFTDRRLDGGGHGSTAGVDGLLRKGNYRLELQGVGSWTEEPVLPEYDEDLEGTFDGDRHTVALDGEKFSGHGVYASLERSARLWNADFDYWGYSPTFRTDNGFTTRNDYHQTSFWTGLHFRPAKKWLVQWEPSVGIGRVWNWEGRFKDEWLRPQIWFDTRAQTHIGTQYLISKERFGPETFPGIRIWSVWFDSDFSEMLGVGGGFNVGQGIYRDFDEPELADQRNFDLYARFKPVRRLELQTNLDYARMDSRERDEELFAGFILRNRLTLNFTAKWFLRLIVQYNDFGERLDVEPLLTWRLNPFTVFFVGSTSQYLRYDPTDHTTLTGVDWRESSRQYFAKLQYQFRL